MTRSAIEIDAVGLNAVAVAAREEGYRAGIEAAAKVCDEEATNQHASFVEQTFARGLALAMRALSAPAAPANVEPVSFSSHGGDRDEWTRDAPGGSKGVTICKRCRGAGALHLVTGQPASCGPICEECDGTGHDLGTCGYAGCSMRATKRDGLCDRDRRRMAPGGALAAPAAPKEEAP